MTDPQPTGATPTVVAIQPSQPANPGDTGGQRDRPEFTPEQEKAIGRLLAKEREAARAAALAALLAVPTPATPALPFGLSAREAEVLRLVAQGLTDVEVAERLYRSPRTVSTHLRSIYGKLGVNSRAAATAFAIDHGLR